jgi:hypothetical protein
MAQRACGIHRIDIIARAVGIATRQSIIIQFQ